LRGSVAGSTAGAAAQLQRHGEAEGGAGADAAFGRDRAAHQLHQLLADGQAQAGAAVAARGRVVGLLEFLEQAWQRVGRDAGPVSLTSMLMLVWPSAVAAPRRPAALRHGR
jgi:hypothetical protein